jgi:hypothetical protein
MEHVFLHSPDHLSVEQAMRRAEVIALGGSEQLARAVLSTAAGNTLEHGEFWRTCMAFFVRFAGEIDLAMVGPIVDFVESIRHRSVEVHADGGIMLLEPPEPEFSLKGRTPASMLRLVDSWHKRLGIDESPSLTWGRSRYSGLCVGERPVEPDAPATFWQVVELTNSTQLRREGTVLRHCVASYAHLCWIGRSRIWSLRRVVGDKVRSVLTLEIDPRSGAIVQARGLRNRPASGRPLALMQQWAATQNLRLRL